MNVPKKYQLVNEQIRGSGGKPAFGSDAMVIKQALVTNEVTSPHQTKPHNFPGGHFDASALHIQHAVNQTKLNRAAGNGVLRHSVRPGIENRINDFLVSVNDSARHPLARHSSVLSYLVLYLCFIARAISACINSQVGGNLLAGCSTRNGTSSRRAVNSKWELESRTCCLTSSHLTAIYQCSLSISLSACRTVICS